MGAVCSKTAKGTLALFFAIILSVGVWGCSPPENKSGHGGSSQNASNQGDSAPITDANWEYGVTKDQFTDKEIHTVGGDTDVEDGHNGKIRAEITYADGDRLINMRFQYLNDQSAKSSKCEGDGVSTTDQLAAKNERGEINFGVDTTGTQNCNVIKVYFPDFLDWCADCATKVLGSEDFRAKVPLANGSNPVVFMNFKDNKALRAFAEYALAGINETKQKEASASNSEQSQSQAATPEAQLPAQPKTAPNDESAAAKPDHPIDESNPFDVSGEKRPADTSGSSGQSNNSVGADADLDVVRRFYEALGQGDGTTASSLVIPEKRLKGPLSADAITSYYSEVKSPLRIDDIHEQPGLGIAVQYSYMTRDARPCQVSTFVTMDYRNGAASPMISRIKLVKSSC